MILHTPGTIPGKEGEQQIAILKDDTHLSRWIEQYHRLDADLANLHNLVLPLISEGSVVIDAGASLGDHTAVYATRANVVHAFEPQPESFACLRENCEDLPGVVLHNCGLSDRAAALAIAKDPNVGASGIRGKGDVPIEVIMLDSLGLFPDLIKWDVEGHEVLALRGARMTILRCRPIMVIEVHQHGLAAAGFTIRDLWQELLWLEYPRCTDIRTGAAFNPDDGKPEYDIVCTP
ncbi:MAG TPA: FkbM family methyltransferase [Polyangia bacterium]|nr:FkbM family methyltransferase [Polyangia bacterium]